MVVCVRAVPSTVRYVKLYNNCAHAFLMIPESGHVLADPRVGESVYHNLTLKSVGFSNNLTIYSEESKRYLCFGPKKWKLVGSRRNRGEMCQFSEEPSFSGYTRYRSVVDPSYHIGFSANGKSLVFWERGPKGRRVHPPHRCLDFTKLSEKFNIDEHHRRLSDSAARRLANKTKLRHQESRRRGRQRKPNQAANQV